MVVAVVFVVFVVVVDDVEIGMVVIVVICRGVNVSDASCVVDIAKVAFCVDVGNFFAVVDAAISVVVFALL